MKLSARFTLGTLVQSDTARMRGIKNTPALRLVKNLTLLARRLDAVQALLHHPLEISSGFRSPALNTEIGGSRTSRHTLGLAADFTCRKFGSPFQVCRRLARSTIPFDQLIYEFGDRQDGGWIHISFARRPRRRTMSICLGRPGYRRSLRRCPKLTT
ncbi:MAG TPA: D-Ala-D-Ala carboxypeptidase family metallohydrolase [Burkholderiales bacterium]|nr:D-Ala-D-Ala carboxypeptidase family metallohydrolase [Burkholderiales bacterium]